MTPYEAAVTRWARRYLAAKQPTFRRYNGPLTSSSWTNVPTDPLIDWSKPTELRFSYEEPYQYSEYTGGGGDGQVELVYPLLAGGQHVVYYADLTELNTTTALPKLIAEILEEATNEPTQDRSPT